LLLGVPDTILRTGSAYVKPTSSSTLGFQLTLAARLYRTQLARHLSEIGLFPGQEQVLKALGSAPDGLVMGDLARLLQVQPPTLTKTIQRLQSQDLILRRARPGDGRVVHLTLTQGGQEKLARVLAAEAALEGQLDALFKPKSGKRLLKGLKRLARHLAPRQDAMPMSPDDEAPEDQDAPEKPA
jgi:DNA-binding MarR family transcriptional regulator